jgi:hypothetical protein
VLLARLFERTLKPTQEDSVAIQALTSGIAGAERIQRAEAVLDPASQATINYLIGGIQGAVDKQWNNIY